MSKKMEKAIKDLKGVTKSKAAPQTENVFAKAARSLVSAAQDLAKGAVDLDAKDYENSDIDAMDTAPRRRRARAVADSGNGYSGMEPTPAEDEDFYDGDNRHRVIVTGKPEVDGGEADEEEWEDPEEPNVGDEEWYAHTRGKRHHAPNPNDPYYAKSENEDEDDEEDGEEKEDKKERFKKMKDKSHNGEDTISKSEQAVYEELLESPDFTEIVESSPVVEHMANVMGKGFGFLIDKIEVLEKGLLAVMEANHTLMKSLSNTPINSPAMGVIGRVGDKNVEVSNGNTGEATPFVKGNYVSSDATVKAWHKDNLIAIERAVTAGEVNPNALTQFDVNSEAVVKSIPEDIRTKYGIKLVK